MVSAKCTRQLSRSSTLASAAATPPSAITVCALPSNDLHTTPTFTPEAAASIAARNPAPPAPITSTSYGYVRYSATLQDSPVGPDTHRAEADVNIGEAHRAEACPRQFLVGPVQAGDAIVELVPHRVLRNLVECASDQMPERVTAEHISAQQHHIDGQDDGAQPDSEAPVKPQRPPHVIDQEGPYNVRE